MNNKERLAISDRVQENIQKNLPHYQILRKKEKIERELKQEK